MDFFNLPWSSKTDLDHAIAATEAREKATPEADPEKPIHRARLVELWRLRFELTTTGTDLDHSIALGDELDRRLPVGHPGQPWLRAELARSLRLRHWFFGDLRDLDRALRLVEEIEPHTPPRPSSQAQGHCQSASMPAAAHQSDR